MKRCRYDLAAARLMAAAFLFLSLLAALPVWADDSYQIGAGDVLSITVYGHDDLKTKVRVSENGGIEFPLIGTVQVGGLKPAEAAKKIEKLLADGYIVNPQAQIYVEEFKSRKVVVLGQVKTPGLVELSGPTTLLEAISKAGGLDKDAGSTVTVTRTVADKQETINIDIKKLIEKGDSGNSNMRLLGGETISVAAAKAEDSPVAYVTGEVSRPGAYPCAPGATVLKMVSLAGGFTNIASRSRVKINRTADGRKQILKNVDFDAPVLPDDVIEVPESFF
ncbi:SLBB domain-containing protein [Desulfobulbus sp. F4]|nr:SLBB domain-containing protein [Desulfobulbus sp. F3]MCW5200367.1 SLBB domain-containing protein [Desulfobulbus sp. F4]